MVDFSFGFVAQKNIIAKNFMLSFRNFLTVSKDDIIIWVAIFHGNTFHTLYLKETRVKIVVGCKFSFFLVSVSCKRMLPWLSANGLNGREILDIKFKIILFLTCDHIHPQLRYKLSKIDKHIYFEITKTNKYSYSFRLQKFLRRNIPFSIRVFF